MQSSTKMAIAAALLFLGIASLGWSVKVAYFSPPAKAWTESESTEIDELAGSLHDLATRREDADTKKAKEDRLRQLYAKQDALTSSRRWQTWSAWWLGLLLAASGVGLVWMTRRQTSAA